MYIYIHMYVYEPLPDTGRGFAPMTSPALGIQIGNFGIRDRDLHLQGLRLVRD